MAMTERDQRALKILGVVGGLAIVAFLLLKVLGGGGGEEVPSSGPIATGTSTGAPGASDSPSLTPTPTLTVPPVHVFSGRDPFSIPPSLLSPVSSASSSSSSSSSPTGTGSPTGSGTPSSKTVGGHVVTLDAVFRSGGVEKVQVEVDGTVYVKADGERFATNYQVESIDLANDCATFLYGSESFDLCAQSPK